MGDNPLYWIDEVGIRHYYQPLRRLVPVLPRVGAALGAYGLRQFSTAWQGYTATLRSTQAMSQWTSGRRSRTWSESQMGSRVSRPVKQYVKRCMRQAIATKEITVTGVIGNAGVPTTAGRVDPIGTFNIVTGAADDQREANTIVLDSVRMKLTCTKPANSDAAIFRVIVFLDRQCNGSTPAITDVITTGTGGLNGGYNGDFVRGVGGSRFKILRDYRFVINSEGSATGANSNVVRLFDWRFLKPATVHFDASTGAIGDITGGEIFIATISDVATASVFCTQQTVYHDG